MKRIISIVLSIALVATLFVPALADWSESDQEPVGVLSVESSNGSNVNALLPGDKFFVVLTISGLKTSWNSLQFQLNYNEDMFELEKQQSGGQERFNYVTGCPDYYKLFKSLTVNDGLIGALSVTGAVTFIDNFAVDDYDSYLNPGDKSEFRDLVVLKAQFTVRDDAKPGSADFYLSQSNTISEDRDTYYEIGFTATSGYSIVTTSTDDLRETVNVVESNSVVITGADAIAAPIAGDDEYGWPKDNTIEAQYGVTVFGSNGVIENPTVTWDISGNGDKVTIDNSGKVTIKSGAAAGDYTITATASIADNTGLDKDAAGTKTIRVTKEDSVPSRIKGREPAAPAGPYVIPDDGANAVSEQFSIYVWDQYGVEMADPDVKWKLSPSDVPGVSLSNNGLLTITNDAKNSSIDTTGTQFTINAYCGELGPVATDVTVKRADSVATSVAIYKGEEVVTSDSITVPTGDISNTVTYTAKVFDQYGTEITNASVTWNTEGSVPSGVTVANDTVTVQKGATTGSFTLKAASGNIKTPLTVNVVTIAFTGQDTAVSAVDSPIYGMTWGEIIKVNDSAISAKVGETQVEGTYSVENADTIPDAGNSVEYRVIFTSNDGNYVGVEVARGTVEIAQKPVTVSGITASNKVYDGNTSATIETSGAAISDIVGNDDVTIDVAKATGTFDTKNVGTGKTVTIIDITLGGNDAGNYTLSSDSATATADITAKTVTVSGITASNKVYDGNTSATIETSGAAISDIVGNDDVTIDVAKATGTFEDKNVGTRKTVTITGIALGGADKDNYTLTSDSANATASITASSSITDTTNKTQNVVVGVGSFAEPTFTGVNVSGVAETVEGTVTYTIDGAPNMTYEQAKAALAQKDKGRQIEVGYSFTSTDTNYVTTAQTDTITVTMVDIAFEIREGGITVDNAPVYGATWGDIVKVDGSKITAKVGEDIVTGGTYTVKDASIRPGAGSASWEVLFTGTLGDKTYTNVTVQTSTVTVKQKELTITGLSAADKPYDGNTTATVSGTAVLNGVLAGDTVNLTTGTAAFDIKNAGTQTVTFFGYGIEGASASNYVLSAQPAPVTATISPKPVTITGVTAENKTYDGNTTATIDNPGTINGIISPDTVTIKAGTGTFAGADVGENIEVTFSGFSLTGTDSGNYTLSAQPASTIANITKANYTGTPNTVNVNVLINQSAAQTGSVSIDQFFQTIPAGAVITGVTSTNDNVIDDTVISEDGKEITYTSKTGLTTEGAKDTYAVTIETKNYNDIEATLTFTTVAKTPVNISGVSVTGAGKTYDGRAVSYAGTPVAKTNDGTEVTVTGTYSYVWQTADGAVLSAAPKDAGSYKLVITLNDTAYLGSAEVSFTISKAQVTITANDAEAYTGSDMPKLSYTVTGLASGESLAVEPTLSCAADMRKAGSYEIEVSGAAVPDTGNYVEAITYVSGVLTVKDRPINIGPVYDITVLKSDHGTVKASLSNASEGSTIRLTVTPDEGYSLYSITVRAENGKLIDVSKSGGVYSFKMPASAVTVQASFVKGTMKLPFNDVSTYDWFYDAVMYAYSNGIMNGLDTNVFGPNETTTRAMLVTMLYRAVGEPAVSGSNTFRDVAANTWYTDAIIWASTNGIVTGVDDGLFNPNGAITREQLATILYRYAKYVGDDVSASASLAGFTDAGSISDYAKDAMSWAVAAGLFEGRDNGKLEPTGTATRAEIATVFMRHFG